jgi:hypothetical protein
MWQDISETEKSNAGLILRSRAFRNSGGDRKKNWFDASTGVMRDDDENFYNRTKSK